jgi:thiol-disulfide isomerase/thioredoxin
MHPFLHVAPLLLSAHLHASPPGAAAADPDPKQLLQECQTAMRASKGVSYDGKVEPIGVAATQLPALTVRVTLAKADDPAAASPINGKFGIRGQATSPEAEEPLEVYLTYNGTKVQLLKADDKQVLEADLDSGGDELLRSSPGTFAIVQEFLIADPLEDELTATTITLEGTGEAGGVPCHTVAIDFGDPTKPNVKWFIADADHLPRRIEHTLQMQGQTGGVGITLNNLATEDRPQESAFAIQTPDGYEVKQYVNPLRPPLLKVGDEAPAWTLKDPEGTDHSLADYKGKTVVIDFWASWCGPCKRAMPGIQRIQDRYAGQPVAVLGLDCMEKDDEGTAKAASYFKDQSFTYTLLLGADQPAKDYHVSSIPAIYVIGPDGKIAMVTVGFNPALDEKVAGVIDTQLKGQGNADTDGK